MKYFLTLSILAITLSGLVWAATPVLALDTELQLVNPLGGTKQKPVGVTSATTLIGTVIKMVMGVVGALVLLMFFWGASQWIGGNAEKIKGGAKTMAWAAVGALAVFTSYLLLKFTLPFFGN